MGHRIVRRFLVPLLRLLLPATGHRRQPHTATRQESRPVAAYLHSRTARRPWERPLRGENTPLARPYLVAHERREQERRQRARQRTLRLAVHGVDIRPRAIHIHGTKVTA